VARVLALAVLAGAFITSGALFSVLLATGASTEGTARLLEGFGFSAGFFFVVLSGAVLFTEANVVLPAVLLGQRRVAAGVARFWVLAFVGNLAGAALWNLLPAGLGNVLGGALAVAVLLGWAHGTRRVQGPAG
jgi:formate transporter